MRHVDTSRNPKFCPNFGQNLDKNRMDRMEGGKEIRGGRFLSVEPDRGSEPLCANLPVEFNAQDERI